MEYRPYRHPRKGNGGRRGPSAYDLPKSLASPQPEPINYSRSPVDWRRLEFSGCIRSMYLTVCDQQHMHCFTVLRELVQPEPTAGDEPLLDGWKEVLSQTQMLPVNQLRCTSKLRS